MDRDSRTQDSESEPARRPRAPGRAGSTGTRRGRDVVAAVLSEKKSGRTSRLRQCSGVGSPAAASLSGSRACHAQAGRPNDAEYCTGKLSTVLAKAAIVQGIESDGAVRVTSNRTGRASLRPKTNPNLICFGPARALKVLEVDCGKLPVPSHAAALASFAWPSPPQRLLPDGGKLNGGARLRRTMYHRNDRPFGPFSGFNARAQHTPTGAAHSAESGLCVAAEPGPSFPPHVPDGHPSPSGSTAQWSAPVVPTSDRAPRGRHPESPLVEGCSRAGHVDHRTLDRGEALAARRASAPDIRRQGCPAPSSSAALPHTKAHDARATCALAGGRTDAHRQCGAGLWERRHRSAYSGSPPLAAD